MLEVNFNEDILSEKKLFLSDFRRGFNFGDGVFETIRVINGQPVFFDGHYKRLNAGLRTLMFDIPTFYSKQYFLEQIKKLLIKNNIKKGGRVRLSVFRSGNGTYIPNTNSPSFLIEANEINNNEYVINEKGLTIDIFNDLKKNHSILSSLKTSNSLEYVLPSIFAKNNGFDDCLLLNNNGHIIESTNSNVFIVINKVLYTPPISDGCVGGVTRMNLINLLVKNKAVVYESNLNAQHLLSADEILLTNTIQGISWVSSFKNKRYFNNVGKQLLNDLNKEVFSCQLDSKESLI
tara:strand:- start:6180 stop:7052 length:873 start_codon:yes stop_codon:yes gene_type:complete